MNGHPTSGDEVIRQADPAELTVLNYPHPVLRGACVPIETFDEPLRALVERMFEIMFASRGVGLAGPQVGLPVRLFIASASFEPTDRQVYINPEVLSLSGQQDGEEGCLSFPDISCKVRRAQTATIRAVGLDGEPFEQTGQGLLARILQHESDHLEGRLLVDRMSSVARLAHRRALRELETAYAEAPR